MKIRKIIKGLSEVIVALLCGFLLQKAGMSTIINIIMIIVLSIGIYSIGHIDDNKKEG